MGLMDGNSKMSNFIDENPDKATYKTDDRDYPIEDQMALTIIAGGNGDWYVSTHPVGQVSIHAVRICTSGGASSQCPRLGIAIAEAFSAIKNAELKKPLAEYPPSYVELLAEVQAWRSKYTNQEFDQFNSIKDKISD